LKAAVFKDWGAPLCVESIADPTPGPDEVVIEVGRCGICGTDLHITEAIDPRAAPPHPLLAALRRRFGPGAVLGHEYAGEVVALGRRVATLKIGDRITALPFAGCGECAACRSGELVWCAHRRSMHGGFGEYTLVSERSAVPLPQSLSLDDGALIEPLAVGRHAVDLARVRSGARVLVLGAGPMGLAVTFWCRRAGATRIAVVARGRRRESLARTVGASEFIVQQDGLSADLAAALGGPPDVVFECVGGPGLVAQAIECVAPRGVVAIVGMCMATDSFTPVVGMTKEARLQFVMAYSRADFDAATDALDAGAVEPRAMLTGTVSLVDAPMMFESLRAPSSHCKVLVSPGPQ
jgi:(R,R)-butanediol dehydrogenase/meso-butanediol dehydrogenase/diacetyl reductase